jgi:tetratricopeptide (TPR) repeat protein
MKLVGQDLRQKPDFAAMINVQVQYGPNHPKVATCLHNLAELCKNQGRYNEAESLYQRALTICERTLGSVHQATQTIRTNYTSLLKTMKGEEKAES